MAEEEKKEKALEEKSSEEKEKPTVDYSLTRKEIKFSNRVRVRGGKGGFFLTFTQTHPDSKELLCIAEIHLPPMVAGSLATILLAQTAAYETRYKTKITPPGMQIEASIKKQEPEKNN